MNKWNLNGYQMKKEFGTVSFRLVWFRDRRVLNSMLLRQLMDGPFFGAWAGLPDAGSFFSKLAEARIPLVLAGNWQEIESAEGLIYHEIMAWWREVERMGWAGESVK